MNPQNSFYSNHTLSAKDLEQVEITDDSERRRKTSVADSSKSWGKRGSLAKPCAVSECPENRLPGSPYCKKHKESTSDSPLYNFRVFAMAGKNLVKAASSLYAVVKVTFGEGGVQCCVAESVNKIQTNINTSKTTDPVWLEAFTFTSVPLDKNGSMEIGIFDFNTKKFFGRVVVPGQILKASVLSFVMKEPTFQVTVKPKRFSISSKKRPTPPSSINKKTNESMWEGIRSRWEKLDSRPTEDGGVEPQEQELGHLHYIIAPTDCALNQLSTAQLNPKVDDADEFSRTSAHVTRAEVFKSEELQDEEKKAIQASMETLSAVEKMKALAMEKTLTQEQKQKKAHHRELVRQELISTERTYVTALATVVDQFVKPLTAAVKTNELKLSNADIAHLTSNIEMLKVFHAEFLASLEESTEVAKTIEKLCKNLPVYVQYLNDYPKMLEIQTSLGKKKAFREFMANVRTHLPSDLMSLMIQPVQRVPRYVLLLKELKKFTLVSHPEHDDLGHALAEVCKVALDINEGRRKMEQQSQLVDIANKVAGDCQHDIIVPARFLVREAEIGTVHKSGLFGSMKVKVYRFFLFNDSLLWTSLSYAFKGFVSMSAVQIDKESSAGPNGFMLFTSKVKVCLQFQDAATRDAWLNDLKHITDTLKDKRKQQRTLKRMTKAPSSASTLHSSVTRGLSTLNKEQGIVVDSDVIDLNAVESKDSAQPEVAEAAAAAADPAPVKRVYKPRQVAQRSLRRGQIPAVGTAPLGAPLAAAPPADTA